MENKNLENEGTDTPITVAENTDKNIIIAENEKENIIGSEEIKKDIADQENASETSEGTAVVPLILGIVSLVFGCIPVVGLATGILAFILSGSNMQAKYAFVARILGTLGIVLAVVLILLKVRRVIFF